MSKQQALEEMNQVHGVPAGPALTQHEIIERARTWVLERPVRLCVLFGSQATGRTHPRSDVDLAVWPEEPFDPMLKLRWVGELEDLLRMSVSLVVISPQTDPVLGQEINRDGILILEAEEGLWMQERRRMWHLYNDSLPFRRALRESLKEFARETLHGS